MQQLPKLFFFAMLLLAATMLLSRGGEPQASTPDTSAPAQLQSGQHDSRAASGLEFVPSEEIGADRSVAFPADI